MFQLDGMREAKKSIARLPSEKCGFTGVDVSEKVPSFQL